MPKMDLRFYAWICVFPLLFSANNVFAATEPRVIYSVSIPFNPAEDGVCVVTKEFKFSKTTPLGGIAGYFGACHGISATAQAFKNHVRFSCAGKAPNHAQSNTLIDRVLRSALAGNDDTFDVRGHCNLKSFCEAHKKLFQMHILDFNADLSLTKALPLVPYLKRGATKEAQLQNPQEISNIYSLLSDGRPALMIYWHHVVMVIGMKIQENVYGAWTARLTLYNPDDNEYTDTYDMYFAADLKQTLSENPIVMLDDDPLISRVASAAR